MKVFTIGFGRKGAREFFEALRVASVRRIVDIRLQNTSQLAGFTKRDDLEYFAGVVCGISYHHVLELAPTQEILDGLKKRKGAWEDYAGSFLGLLEERGVIGKLELGFVEDACLLCSEPRPDRCHRRLVAERMAERWPGLEIVHL